MKSPEASEVRGNSQIGQILTNFVLGYNLRPYDSRTRFSKDTGMPYVRHTPCRNGAALPRVRNRLEAEGKTFCDAPTD